MPNRLPVPSADIVARDWIRALRDELQLSEERFAEALRAGSRDTVAKWVAKNPQEPGFTFTRRMVTIAPPHLVETFVARPDRRLARPDSRPLDNGSGVRTIPEGALPGANAVTTYEAQYIAAKLDEIQDEDVRAAAMEACSAALRKVLRPSELGAATRPGRTQRK